MGGLIILAIGLIAWDYYLFQWLTEPLWQENPIGGFAIDWGWYLLVWDAVVLAWVVTIIFDYHLLNALH